MHTHYLHALTIVGTLAALSLTPALRAQTASIAGATLDITVVPQAGAPQTQTFVTGAATGTPFNGQQFTLRPTDVVQLTDAAVLAQQDGTCDLDGVTAGLSIATQIGGITVGSPTVNVLLDASGACPTLPASAPASLPPCATGRELYTAGAGQTATLDIAAILATAGLPPFLIPPTQPFALTVTLTPTSSTGTCAIAPVTVTATVFLDPNAPVPVEIASLTGERRGGRDYLAWTVANEVELAGYAVERSGGGEDFSELTFVEAEGTGEGSREYREAFAVPPGRTSSTSYYRLRAVDFDGTFDYSPVIVVMGADDLQADGPAYLLTTVVPAGAGAEVTYLPAGATWLEFYDLSGRLQLRTAATVGDAIGHELPAGQYLVRTDADGPRAPQRITVQ